jgi:hypothetical protein
MTSRLMVVMDGSDVPSAPRGKQEAESTMIAVPECQESPLVPAWDEGFHVDSEKDWITPFSAAVHWILGRHLTCSAARANKAW